jgi:predicted dehydrogenase
MRQTPNVAVVGAGAWGKNIIRVLQNLGALACVCDPIAYADGHFPWEEILTQTNINAVIIALPGQYHAQYAKEALLAGKHVFVEKPFTTDLESAQELHDLAISKNKILMVGHLLHYHNAFIKLKQMVQAGLIGEVSYIESSRLHIGPRRYDIGILWELLPHDVSMLLGIINILDVNNSTKTQVSNISLQHINFNHTQENLNSENLNYADLLDIKIEFNNNIKARLCSSWMYPIKQHRFWICGSSGMLVFEDARPWSEKLQLYNYETKIFVNIELTPAEPLVTEIQTFLTAITTDTPVLTDSREGLAVMKMLTNIERSYNPQPLCTK